MALTKISTAMWNSVPHHLSHDFNVDDVLFVDVSDNKVGIGTTSPIDQLHIKSTTTDARMVLDGHTGFDAELKFFEAGTSKYTVGYDAATTNFVIGTTNVDTGQRLVIDSSGNVGVGSQNPVGKFEVNTGSSAAYFTRTAGNNGSSAPAFGILTDASLTRLYSWGTGMTFWTASVGGTATEKMRLTNTGLLGIGCTPIRELEVEGAGNVYIRVNAKTDNDSTAIELVNTQETWTIRNDDTNNDAFEIDSSTTGNIVTIQKTGNVGIGTTTPEQKLHVEGRTVLDSGISSDIVQFRNDSGGFVFGNTSNLASLDLSATSNLRIRQGASVPFYLDSSGNVGIGDTSPADKLEINGLTTYPHIRLTASSNTTRYMRIGMVDAITHTIEANGSGANLQFVTGATPRMLINSGGNVGIGTTSPSYKLTVDDDTPYGGILIQGANAPALTLLDESGTAKNLIYAQSTSISQGIIRISADDNNTGTDSRIEFQVDGSERLRIDSSGNVGIGTDSPDAKLEISDSNQQGASVRLTRNDSTVLPDDTIGVIEFYNTDADGAHVSSFVKGIAQETYGRKGALTFGVAQTNSTDAVEAMRITSGGDVLMQSTKSGEYTALELYNIHGSSGSQGSTTLTFSVQNSIAVKARSSIKSEERTTDSNLTNLIFSVSDNNSGNPAEAFRLTGGASAGNPTYLRMASGTGGIQFGGDTSPANALDDYEEGTWTPTLYGSSSAGSYSLSSVYANYRKIGSVVHISALFAVTVNSAGGGYAVIGGLPFTKPALQSAVGSLEVRGFDIDNSVMQTSVMFTSYASSNTLYISGQVDNAGSVDCNVTGFSTGDIVIFSITYFV